MKQLYVLLFGLLGLFSNAQSPATSLFDESRVAKIFLVLPADSLQQMINTLENNYYYHARFVFDDGVVRDTLESVGLRLRGNTSLVSQKKSFKISFNAYETGREYQGVRKLNLLGSHNDPTMIREKLFYHVWGKAGMPERRGSFVQLYINNEYRGLYTNMEEIDKQWLTRVFGNNDGNLYKCTWPADLQYLGENEEGYKAIMNNPESRAYDLVTNETADDYSRFVALVKTLNQPVDGNYETTLQGILNVESVLKAFALDVATGNWDDYFVNKNNYYLYDSPVTGRFEFITFDTDNTFGVDWVGSNWAKRNALEWHTTFEPRPLATQLLQSPAYFTRYVQLLDSFTRHILRPALIFPKIDYYHQLITPSAVNDVYRTLDWGYDFADFQFGITQTIDDHTPYGIKPFLETRYDSTMAQIAPFVVHTGNTAPQMLEAQIFPNPSANWILVQTAALPASETVYGALYDALGRTVKTWNWEPSTTPHALWLSDIPAGAYRLHLHTGGSAGSWTVLKSGL